MSDLTDKPVEGKPPMSFCADCHKLARVYRVLGRWLCELCKASYER